MLISVHKRQTLISVQMESIHRGQMKCSLNTIYSY